MVSLLGSDLNPVLSILKLGPEDKVIAVREQGIAESNFIITHIIKKILKENGKICFVTSHNSIEHYQSVGRLLGYDFKKKIEDETIKVVNLLEVMNKIMLSDGEDNILTSNEKIINFLSHEIQLTIQIVNSENNSVHLIIDDLSHLLDLGVNTDSVKQLIRFCINQNNLTSTIINNHESDNESELLNSDTILSNVLSYVADLIVEVSPLKTGRSSEVSGVINISRPNVESIKYHYKCFDRGVKIFRPGESLMNLYK